MALEQISIMQSELLATEEKRRELETGLEVVQTTLRTTMKAREEARQQVATLTETGDDGTPLSLPDEAVGTVNLLASALAETAAQRDQIADDAGMAIEQAAEMQLELRLLQ